MAVLTFIWMAIIAYAKSEEAIELKGKNEKLSARLFEYEKTVIQMEEQGWSKNRVDEFVQRGCVPFFEAGGR